ncbi:hypothetical protein CYY_003874 [Polysphondylium violaceum]|uniref:Uncharacterized protein n=1 Tax=Polysphondylium violaceum TaxID=133409 RepID=A0A8J4PX18_9MYCE|nr:hypothetical protein CYY_003874 [Polysphondylium violaceum]
MENMPSPHLSRSKNDSYKYNNDEIETEDEIHLETSTNHPPTTTGHHSDENDIQEFHLPKDSVEHRNVLPIFSDYEQIILITGGTSGLGYQIALKYLSRGWKVIITGTLEKYLNNSLRDLKASFEGKYGDSIFGAILDLGSKNSIQKFLNIISSLKKIDILVCNAAIQAHDYHETQDGDELNMGINYIGHFILTLNLLGLLENSNEPQILNIVCKFPSDLKFNQRCTPVFKMTGQKPYDSKLEYQRSKLALVSFTISLSQRIEESSKSKTKLKTRVNCIDPGVMRDTNIERHQPKTVLSQFTMAPPLFTSKSSDGVEFVARLLDQEHGQGKYFVKDKEAKTPIFVQNKSLLNTLWKNTIKLAQLEHLDTQYFKVFSDQTKNTVGSPGSEPNDIDIVNDRIDKLNEKVDKILEILQKQEIPSNKPPMNIQQ